MRLLLADSEDISRRMTALFLTGIMKITVDEAKDGAEALSLFNKNNYDLVFVDMELSGINGLQLLKDIQAADGEKGKTPVVLLTNFGTMESAVEAVRNHAYDYLYKPIDTERLSFIIEQRKKEISLRNSGSEENYIEKKEKREKEEKSLHRVAPIESNIVHLPTGDDIGIFSPELREAYKTALVFHEDRSIPVLIEGESGTGKELFAKLVHYGADGSRETRPMVSINCAAISPSLFESELFGYEGHTFTGAKESGMSGKLEQANTGTILLDEVGDMPLEMQPKLLRVLQDHQLFRIGATKPINLDIRVVAATNRDLKDMVAEGRFRADLYHRLKIGWITLPPLRNQKTSIPAVADMILAKASERRGRNFRYISKSALNVMTNYSWPGNLRELRNVIERIVLLNDSEVVRTEHLSILDEELKYKPEDDKFTLSHGNFKLPEDAFSLRDFELEIVKLALYKFKGNKTKTARYLGLTLSSLRSRLDDIAD